MKKLSVMLVLVMALAVVANPGIQAEEVAPLEDRITSYFARVMDTNAIQLVHEAQLHFAEDYLADTEYTDLPLVSQVAPQKAGREDDGGPDFFIDIDKDSITEEDLASLYFFEDKLAYKKMSGAELLEWMEAATDNFNQIDPEETDDQFLIDDEYMDYDFDQFAGGLVYEIDVTEPVGNRIKNAEYEGEPLAEIEEIIIATNNFRAGGGGDFPNVIEENKLMATEKNMRDAIADYLNYTDGEVPDPTHNWHIKPVEVAGQVLFESSPDAEEYAGNYDIISHIGGYAGWGIYSYEINMTP